MASSLPGNCVAISQEGNDESQCLNHSTNVTCKSIEYVLTKGFSSLCLNGTFYKTSERIAIDWQNEINIDCNSFRIENSQFILFCQADVPCNINFLDCIMIGNIIKLSNINITFRNVTMEDTVISDFSDLFDNGTNGMFVVNSVFSCNGPLNTCGFYLNNISSTKLVIIDSHLNNFRLNISVRQLILTFHDTYMISPAINVNPHQDDV